MIATGGGAFMDDETRALILDALHRDLARRRGRDVCAERVGRRGHRPLLDGKDPRAALGALAEARNPVYAEAHLTVRSDAVPHERTVERIVAAARPAR